jgi:hypothetical protein
VANPTAVQRKAFAASGVAMPDGSYYIRNSGELSDAISAVGRATPNAGESDVARRNSVRRHIIKRANALGLSNMIPDTWNSDGSLKHSDFEELLAHFGVKGMHWGVRRPGTGTPSSHVSPDAARAHQLRSVVNRHGVSALSNQDLQHLVTRQNLERQHGQLNPEKVSAGHAIVNELLKVGGSVAKQQATTYANKYAAEGIDALLKKAG